MELLILVDNSAGEPLRGEHGFSVLVAGPGRTVLFDTGASVEVLQANAEALGVDLAGVDSVVISHGHYDHVGGLPAVAACRAGVEVYAHPAAFSRRWSTRPGRPMKDVSAQGAADALKRHGAVLRPVSAAEMIADWAVLSGPIGGPHHGGNAFVIRRADDIVVDGFEDETMLLIRGADGWTLLTGCCHRGLRNCLRMASFLTRGEPISSVLGGLHLRDADAEELGRTVELLEEFGSPAVFCCHCTGERASEYLAERMGDKVQPVSAGFRTTL